KIIGEIVFVNILGTHMVFINSRRLAYKVFDKLSSLYSDRIKLPILSHALHRYDWAFSFQRCGDRWRRHRRVMHQKFLPVTVEAYKPVQLK
ncbi:hypothetical protein M422DRAFT_126548, partial [Sphaerobolus stellatus SS14]